MNKKWIGIVAIIVCLILAIFCWPQKVKLKIGIFAGSNWDVPSGDSYQVIDRAIERFEKQYPDIEVVYQSGILKEDYSLWLSSQFLEGTEPDVFLILDQDFNTLSSLGALKDLSGHMADDPNFDSKEYYKSALESGIYQDTQYALPYESNPQLMFVNKTLLKNENIEIPDNSWTLEDFYKICKQVTKDTNHDGIINQYGCYDFDWLDSVYSHGVQLFNEDGTECYLSQEPMKQAISFLKKLNQLNQGRTITSTEFDKGQVAFMPMPFSQYRTYMPYPWRVKKYSTFEWDCVKMPSLSKEQNMSEVSTLLMGISSRTSYPKESWELLKMLSYDRTTQLDLFKYSQGVSSLKTITQSQEALSLLGEEVFGDSQVDMSLLNDVMENTVSHNQFKKYDSTLSLIETKVVQIIDNDDDLDTELMNLQKEINQYLNE